MAFLDEDYLLETDAARELYDSISDLGIIDPHSHIAVDELRANDGWTDVWEVEGATDHYVWSLMRQCGVEEELITGERSNREKWRTLCAVLPSFAGNPTYEWLHLDLKRRFGIETPVSAETADEIWERTETQLATDSFTQQTLLSEMNVEVVCSTDDPTDSLDTHEAVDRALSGVTVRPTWRVDRALRIDQPDWIAFTDDLATATGVATDTFDGFCQALSVSHEYFDEHGCRASDCGLQQPVTRPVSRDRAASIFARRRDGYTIDSRSVEDFVAYLLEFVVELNVDRDWVTQLHIGAVRDYRQSLFESLGSAAGGSVSSGSISYAASLDHLLDRFDDTATFVCYCLDPTDYPSLATIARAYPSVNIGAAWWFNDSPFGIEQQLEYVGTVTSLASHAGMVSDSRKLCSFGSRFEMFRRSLANVLGRQVDRGQLPLAVAGDLVEHVAYDRPKELYGL